MKGSEYQNVMFCPNAVRTGASFWRKKRPLTAVGLHTLRDGYTCTRAPARALAAEGLILERTFNDLVNQAYTLTPAEIALMWQTAPPRMPVPPP